MLGHALHRTGSFGFPLEYTNPANLAEWKQRLGLDSFNAVLTEIQQRRTSPNGVFGIKIHYTHLKQFGGFQNVVKCFPNAYYILLSRKDVLKQAVSLSIASQTGVWIAGQKPVTDSPQYSFEHVDRCLRRTILENSSWRYVLAASGCKYIELNFDEIRNNLARSIEEIAAFVDVTVDQRSIPGEPVTTKQSDGLNAQWLMQFLADFNGSELLSSRNATLLARIKGRMKRMTHA